MVVLEPNPSDIYLWLSSHFNPTSVIANSWYINSLSWVMRHTWSSEGNTKHRTPSYSRCSAGSLRHKSGHTLEYLLETECGDRASLMTTHDTGQRGTMGLTTTLQIIQWASFKHFHETLMKNLQSYGSLTELGVHFLPQWSHSIKEITLRCRNGSTNFQGLFYYVMFLDCPHVHPRF